MISHLIVLDILVWFTIYLFISISSIYFNSYLQGGNTLVAGIAVGIFFFTRAVCDLIFPRIFKDGKLLVQIMLALIIQIISFVMLISNTNIYMSLLSVSILGISMGLYNPAKLALFATINKRSDEKRWGNLDSAGLIAISLAGFISGVVVKYGNFRNLFAIAIFCSVSTFLLFLRLFSIKKV
jgi:MFS family permease